MADYKLVLAIAEYTTNLQFADPQLQLCVPKLLGSVDALNLHSSGVHYVKDWTLPAAMASGPVMEWTRFVLRKAMQKATVIVAPVHELDEFGLEELAGKTVITATVNDERISQMRDKGVATVIDGSPVMHGHVLDAMIMAATGKSGNYILDDDYLEILTGLQTEQRIIHSNGFHRINRFAFVIHPLSQEYFKQVKHIEMLFQVSPRVLMNTLGRAMAYAPPFVYSRVTGIQSPMGVMAEG
jgi:hypothetical protein